LLHGMPPRQPDPGAWPTARHAALAQRPPEIASQGPPSRKRKDGTPSATQEHGAGLQRALILALASVQLQRPVLVLVLVLAQLQRLVLVRAPRQQHAPARAQAPTARGVEWASQAQPQTSRRRWWAQPFPGSQQQGRSAEALAAAQWRCPGCAVSAGLCPRAQASGATGPSQPTVPRDVSAPPMLQRGGGAHHRPAGSAGWSPSRCKHLGTQHRDLG